MVHFLCVKFTTLHMKVIILLPPAAANAGSASWFDIKEEYVAEQLRFNDFLTSMVCILWKKKKKKGTYILSLLLGLGRSGWWLYHWDSFYRTCMHAFKVDVLCIGVLSMSSWKLLYMVLAILAGKCRSFSICSCRICHVPSYVLKLSPCRLFLLLCVR